MVINDINFHIEFTHQTCPLEENFKQLLSVGHRCSNKQGIILHTNYKYLMLINIDILCLIVLYT